MKLVFQALVGSIMVHLIYVVITMLIGYIQTKNYTPDFTKNNANIVMLQNEVAFGLVMSPQLFIYTFIGVAIICGIVMYMFKKVKKCTAT